MLTFTNPRVDPRPRPSRTSCPSCGNPSGASHRACGTCNARLGTRTAKLLARAQSDPAFATVLLGQLTPLARSAFSNLLMKSWVARKVNRPV